VSESCYNCGSDDIRPRVCRYCGNDQPEPYQPRDPAVLVGALELIAIDHVGEFGQIARDALAEWKGGQ